MKLYSVCPSLELVEEEISWEEIPSAICDYKDYLRTMEEIREEEKILNEFDKTCKSIDDIPEHEQTEYIADLIINSFFN